MINRLTLGSDLRESMSYIERIVIAGKTQEVSRYHSIRTGGVPEGKRRRKLEPTPERIERSNMRRRTDKIRQLMNANFNDKDFWSMTLTYRKGEEPKSIRQMRNDAADFIKRLRKCAKLFGVDLKFIYCMGAGKHRRHIHITINALPDMAIFAGCWMHGHVSMTRLYSDGQYKDLADYYMQNAKETKEQEIEIGEKPGKMYVCSQNLTKPVEIKKVISAKTFREEPKPKKGYYIEKESVWSGYTLTGFPMLRYTMIKEDYERDKIVHFHKRPGTGNGSPEVCLPDAVCQGWTGHGNEGRPRDNRRQPEGCDPGSPHIVPDKDK